jgi:hypothetical protein
MDTFASSNTITRVLLQCGVIAGPVYVFIGLVQALTRSGFDITRHDLSLLSNGSLGWIQVANFLLSGGLTVCTAIGMKRVLSRSGGRTWGPLLLGLYGIGLIGAGIFVADPMNGFPQGSAVSSTISFHGLMHFVSGSIGFLGLISSCFIFARRFSSLNQSLWASYSFLTGLLFFFAFVGIGSGSGQGGVVLQAVTLGFWLAVILGWSWIALLSLKLMHYLV